MQFTLGQPTTEIIAESPRQGIGAQHTRRRETKLQCALGWPDSIWKQANFVVALAGGLGYSTAFETYAYRQYL